MRVYAEKAAQLRKRHDATTGNEGGSWLDVAVWAASEVAPDVGKETWRLYRRSLVAVSSDPQVAAALADAGHGAGSQMPRLSYWSAVDLGRMEKYCRDRAAPLAPHALRWVKSTVVTGLRPIEWYFSGIATRAHNARVLQVKTAKTANRKEGSEVPEFRDIPLDHLSDLDLTYVQEQLDYTHGINLTSQYECEQHYRRVANFCNRATREIFGSNRARPTIYSARHEFAIRLQLDGVPVERAAELLGDTPAVVSRNYYASRSELRKRASQDRHAGFSTKQSRDA